MRLYSYEKFKETILEQIADTCPEQKMEIKRFTGINREKENLVFVQENGGSPSVCLQDLYKEYLDTQSWESVWSQICKILVTPALKIGAGILHFWEEDKKNIYPVVVSCEKNLERLKAAGIVYREMLDLVILYSLNVEIPERANGSVKITKIFLDIWGITEEDLYKQCFLNADYRVENFWGMNVLTNRDRYRGAAGVFFSSKLKALAEEKQNDLYLLPSSVHEMILLEQSEDLYDLYQLKQMVQEINGDRNLIAEEDYLSDSIYVYHRKDNEIKIAA